MNYHKRDALFLSLLLAPSVLLLLFLTIYPAFYSIYLGFTNNALTGYAASHPQFVGMRNFLRLFTDQGFWHSLWLTLIFVVGSAVVGQFLLGLLCALLLNRKPVFGRLFSAAILLPNAVPEVIAGFVWVAMLAGGDNAVVNQFVGLFGVAPQHWLRTFPMAMIIIVNIWRGIAFAMILLLSGLASVSRDIYEAAMMDGAMPRQSFFRITLPLLAPTIFLYMLVSTVTTIGMFGLVYSLTRGGPGGATEIIGIYIYDQSFITFQLGYGSAVSFVMLLISVAVGVFYVRLLKVRL